MLDLDPDSLLTTTRAVRKPVWVGEKVMSTDSLWPLASTIGKGVEGLRLKSPALRPTMSAAVTVTGAGV